MKLVVEKIITLVKYRYPKRNLGVTMNDELSLEAHIAAVSQSCRFTLYNIRKIRRYSVRVLLASRVVAGIKACKTTMALHEGDVKRV